MDKVYNEIIDRMKKESFYLSDDLDIDIEVVTLEDAKKIVDEVLNDKYKIDKYKAIDDFVEYVWETTSSSDIEWITRDYELYDLLQKKAEQLKAGGENETI